MLRNEPLATAQTTGSSRSALTPETCWAFRARSSPSTPAVFFAATLVISATSSSMLAISSSRANRLAPATGIFLDKQILKGALASATQFRGGVVDQFCRLAGNGK
ncbi:hypothetical protein D3C80_1821940 [compost metagenome]